MLSVYILESADSSQESVWLVVMEIFAIWTWCIGQILHSECVPLGLLLFFYFNDISVQWRGIFSWRNPNQRRVWLERVWQVLGLLSPETSRQKLQELWQPSSIGGPGEAGGVGRPCPSGEGVTSCTGICAAVRQSAVLSPTGTENLKDPSGICRLGFV